MHPSASWALALLGLTFGPAVRAEDSQHPSKVERPVRELPARASPLVGVVSARQSLDLVSQGEGRLEQLKVRLGERVEAGQVVALLEVKARQLDLAVRQSQLKAAQAEHARYVILHQQARQQLEREQRIRDYSAAESLEKAESALALAAADVALARARVSEVQAQVDIAQENLEQTRLRAPFTGVVSEQYLQPGMMAGRSTPIVRLVSEERLLRFAIPEALASSIRTGDELRVLLDGLPSLQAVVERLSPELDPSSRHLKAEARLHVPAEVRNRVPVGLVVQVEWVAPSAVRAQNGP